jgi:hypothetical protein
MRYSGGCLADRAVCLIDRAAANLSVAHPLRPQAPQPPPKGWPSRPPGQHHAHLLQRTRLVPVPPFGFGFRARARVPMLVALQLVDVYAPVAPIARSLHPPRRANRSRSASAAQHRRQQAPAAGGVKPCQSIARR